LLLEELWGGLILYFWMANNICSKYFSEGNKNERFGKNFKGALDDAEAENKNLRAQLNDALQSVAELTIIVSAIMAQ